MLVRVKTLPSANYYLSSEHPPKRKLVGEKSTITVSLWVRPPNAHLVEEHSQP